MPASRARLVRPGAQAGRRMNLRKVEEKRGFPRSPRKRIPRVPVGIVEGAACSHKRKSEVASGVRILRSEDHRAIEQLPRPSGTALPEFKKRAAKAGPGDVIAPRRPRGMRHEPQLTVVTRAGAGDGEEVIGSLRPEE